MVLMPYVSLDWADYIRQAIEEKVKAEKMREPARSWTSSERRRRASN